MITTDKHFYNNSGIQAELITMPYRIIEGEENDYSDDVAICNSCNAKLNNVAGIHQGHNLIDCMQEFDRRIRNG